MAFNFFKKDKGAAPAGGDSQGVGGESGPAADGGGHFKRDSRKAQAFFKHAHAVADHDYAIECFVNGLKHDPDNLPEHEALYDTALKRKVGGGKPAGLTAKMTGGGKTPVERMLHAERLWAMDPLNVTQIIAAMEKLVEANEAEPDIHMGPVGTWMGGKALALNTQAKPLSANQLAQLTELLASCGAFDKATEAVRRAIAINPGNPALLQRLKDLEAEKSMQKSFGGNAEDFRANIKDADKQRDLEQQDSISKASSVVDQQIAKRRAEFEENPEDIDRRRKLIEALRAKNADESDEEAIDLLLEAHGMTGQYRFKQELGDVRIKMFARRVTAAKASWDAHPQSAEHKKRYLDSLQERVNFELEEFAERAQNYPTDMRWKYELGRRLFQVHRQEEAIAALQQARNDPKFRAASLDTLGLAYLQQGWLDEAIQAFREGLVANPDDRRRLEIEWNLMDSLERSATKSRNIDQARESLKMASGILQQNIGYRDIRVRVDRLRKLVEELEKGQTAA
jgi:tetratricopeptide (TPR) repeat protein